jgi:hypothetical protein
MRLNIIITLISLIYFTSALSINCFDTDNTNNNPSISTDIISISQSTESADSSLNNDIVTIQSKISGKHKNHKHKQNNHHGKKKNKSKKKTNTTSKTRTKHRKKKVKPTNTPNDNTNNTPNDNTNNNTPNDNTPNNSNDTPGILTVNGFEQGQDGGAESECDGQFHSNTEMIAALSTGWYDNGSRCGKMININYNGKTVQAKIVDECDSNVGFDAAHAFQPPCGTNIVDVSQAVWDALGISQNDPNFGNMPITWSDA